MSYLEKARDIYKLMGEGKMIDAFDKYYHKDVVMHEATGEIREGKVHNRAFQLKWMESIETVHDGGGKNIIADEANGITMVEAWTDFTPKGGERRKVEEVCVQKWKDGQIIYERFYYNMPG